MRRTWGRWAALGLACSIAGRALAQAVKIMPIGDGITVGFHAPGGYRTKLWQNLVLAGMTPDFVGTSQENPDPNLPDSDHNGINGVLIGPDGYPGHGRLTSDAHYWMFLAGQDLRYMLLLAGTDDVELPVALSGAPGRLRDLLETYYFENPNVTIILGTLCRNFHEGLDPDVIAFNNEITRPGGILQQEAALGRKIIGVDFYNGIDVANYEDALHPNQAGFNQMADIWTTALLGKRTLQGQLELGVFQGDPTQFTFWLTVTNPGESTPLLSAPFSPNGERKFSIPTTLLGGFDVYVQGGHWLRRKLPAVPIGNDGAKNLAFALTNGDVDGDNSVSVFDYGILSDSFGLTSESPLWQIPNGDGFSPEHADLDGDEAVSIFDYGILSDAFDQSGD